MNNMEKSKFSILITDVEGEISIELYDYKTKSKMNLTAEEVNSFGVMTPVGMMKWAAEKMKNVFHNTSKIK